MKTLIVFATTHGYTEKIAGELQQFLGGDTTLNNLKKNTNPNLDQYNRIIIGGSIHAGQIQKRVKTFCNKNIKKLQEKELGLFICCMEEGETARNQLQKAFPEALHSSAKTTAVLGGEFNFERMNFFEKWIVRKVANIEESMSRINDEDIQSFTKKMDKVFNPFLFLI